MTKIISLTEFHQRNKKEPKRSIVIQATKFKTEMESTLTILGCGKPNFSFNFIKIKGIQYKSILGTLGTAILSGILSSVVNRSNETINENAKLSKFIACVLQPKSAERIRNDLGPSLSKYVNIVQSDQNYNAIAAAKYVILACKPYMVEEILTRPGIEDVCGGKVFISVCAGVSTKQIHDYLPSLPLCTVVRAMPNTASQIHESMTVIESPHPPLNADLTSSITWIFSQIGSVTHLPSYQMSNATALCGSGPAFFALVLEAAIDGAVAMGLARHEAVRMAAQTMKGTAELVLQGEHPALLKDKVTSPGGCTIRALSVLEEGGVRGYMAKAIREAAIIAGTLGKPMQ